MGCLTQRVEPAFPNQHLRNDILVILEILHFNLALAVTEFCMNLLIMQNGKTVHSVTELG